MLVEIPPCSPGHIRRVVVHYRCQVPRFRGITSRVFHKWATVVVLDSQYSTFKY